MSSFGVDLSSNPLARPGLPATVDAVIPALDEEQSLPLVLRDLPPAGAGFRVRNVVVVDNGSRDRTAELAEQGGALVVREPRRGYGAACLAGIEACAADPPEILVFLDADWSDHPEDLPDVLAPILSGGSDFVVGSRLAGRAEPGALPPHVRFGNNLASLLMRWTCGVRYTDLGPFRAIRWSSLMALGMQDRNFGWTVEMQVKAAIQRLRVVEVPVRYRRRVGVSKISGTVSGTVRAGSKILYSVFRYRYF